MFTLDLVGFPHGSMTGELPSPERLFYIGNIEEKDMREDDTIFGHVTAQTAPWFLPLIKENTTIVPLRHPYLVAKSWLDRGMYMPFLVDEWEAMVS